MTENQLSEIRNYLLTKKLPIDILMEVNDHFVSQINDLMKEEQMSFDDAFKETKSSWQSELKPYWNGELDLVDKSKLLRDINRTYFRNLMKKALLSTSIILFVQFIFSKLLPIESFKFVFVIAIGIIFLVPIFNYLRNEKDFQILKKYRDYVLVSVQQYAMLGVGGIYFYFRFFTDGFYLAEMFQKSFIDPSAESIITGIVIEFILLLICFIAIFSQKIYLEKIQKVKPFLQYLKPSR